MKQEEKQNEIMKDEIMSDENDVHERRSPPCSGEGNIETKGFDEPLYFIGAYCGGVGERSNLNDEPPK